MAQGVKGPGVFANNQERERHRKRVQQANRPRGTRVSGHPFEAHVEPVIDLGLVARTASLGCTIPEIAQVLGIDRGRMETLATAPHIARAIEEGRALGKQTLRRLQWGSAQAGSDQMLIWLGKQLLEQRDKADLGIEASNVHRVIAEEPMTEEQWLAKHAPFMEGEVVPVDE